MDPLELPMRELTVQKPFFGYFLQNFRRVADPNMEAGLTTGADEDTKMTLYYNMDQWKTLDQEDLNKLQQGWWKPASPEELEARMRPWTDAELLGQLEHECMHLVLEHVWRRDGRNQDIWALSSCIATNTMVQNHAPSSVGASMFELEDNMTADAYYQRLYSELDSDGHTPNCPNSPQNQEDQQQEPGNDDADQGEAEASDDDSNEDGTSGEHAHGDSDAGDGDGEFCPKCQDHSCDGERWLDVPDGRGQHLMDSVKQAVAKSYEQARRHDKGMGYLPGQMKEAIEDLLKEPYHWAPILRQFCQGAIKRGNKSTIMRGHKKYGNKFPGRKPARTGKVAILIDTSGSVGAEELAQDWAEMREIAAHAEAVCIENDAAVHDVYPMTKNTELPEFKGRGGTVFDQGYALVSDPGMTIQGGLVHERQNLLYGVEGLVILTDGGVIWPEENPIEGRPVLVAITPDGIPPVNVPWIQDIIYIGWEGPDAS